MLRTGNAAPAVTVQSDLLQSLRDALAALDQHYEVIAIVPGLDAEAPSTLGFDIRLTTQPGSGNRRNRGAVLAPAELATIDPHPGSARPARTR